MAGTGEYGARELATPLVSTSQPAGSPQQYRIQVNSAFDDGG